MSDIVERLRQHEVRQHLSASPASIKLCNEAADEIADLSRRLAEAGRENERLRTAIQLAIDWFLTCKPEVKDMNQPTLIKRLRASLTTTPPPGSAAG